MPKIGLFVYFDENVISVTAFGNTITNSGDTVTDIITDEKYTVNLKDGYVIDTVICSSGLDITNITDNTFYAGVTGGLQSAEITITSKPAVPRKSIDLTTLPGWSSLSSGSHSITIVAKADGYRDSEPSAAVSVEKAAPVYTDCITFTGESSDFTLAIGSNGAKEWNGTVEYSTDHNTWTTWNGTAISSVGKKLYLRGSGNTKFYTSKGARLRLSERAACSGNIQTLLEYSNPPTSIPASKCYRDMFYECRNLTQAPELPATTLAEGCYGYMFYGCTSLTTAPELPATTLTNYCYFYMFMDCRSLKISTTQSSEYPTAWRIPSSGTISSAPTGWNYAMLTSTGGTFKSDPSINTTYYGAWGTVTEDPLAGTWVFNDNAYAAYAADNKTFNVTFISNAQTFNSIIFNNNPMNGGMFYDTLRVVHPDDASHFIDQSYRTIAITSKLSEVTDGETLLAWLQSNATKQSTTAPTLISFTIAGTSYQAEEGMTWAEWVNSSYNTNGYYIDGTYIDNSRGRVYTSSSYKTPVVNTDIIVSGHEYYNSGSGGGAGN